eukprot:TRINITY_DN1797_c0_g1_i1.p1 TRINITY_DN1797_c0_g1~~TRINITY_DN1797_c0_g1_i1.p1  ORF type:complete len:104 (+),score=7.89 TRINITY_DN1797_c0_g1_i1:401-712(+)
MQACSFAATLAILCMFMLQWTSDAVNGSDSASSQSTPPTEYSPPQAPKRMITPVTISIILSLKFAADCHALIVGVWRVIKDAIKLQDDTNNEDAHTEPASGGL